MSLNIYIIDATIAGGPHAGKRIFVPIIPMIPSDNICPFHMKRKQFPVHPAFAITSNKTQGQTLSHVGIYLKQGFFSHGELYVAMSSVGSKDSLKIYSDHGVYTSNVVFKEFLTLQTYYVQQSCIRFRCRLKCPAKYPSLLRIRTEQQKIERTICGLGTHPGLIYSDHGVYTSNQVYKEVGEQGKPFYNIVVPLVERVLY